ncbi:hypothetical protein WDU94_007695 [Cyamophila willieti]
MHSELRRFCCFYCSIVTAEHSFKSVVFKIVQEPAYQNFSTEFNMSQLSDHIKMILKAVYFLNHASLYRKVFSVVNMMSKARSLPPLSEVEFKDALTKCIGTDYLEYYDFHSHQCGKSALINALSCSCGGCGRYYRIKIGALNEFDVQDIMSLQ